MTVFKKKGGKSLNINKNACRFLVSRRNTEQTNLIISLIQFAVTRLSARKHDYNILNPD